LSPSARRKGCWLLASGAMVAELAHADKFIVSILLIHRLQLIDVLNQPYR
jgi:hypothetical protein